METQRVSSQREKEEDSEWDPDRYLGDFAALLVCTQCGEPGFLLGATSFEYAADAPDDVEPEDRWKMTYEARLFSPGPPLFAIPGACREKSIRSELKRAWTLFWVDGAACANRIRSCIEMVLTHQRIRRFSESDKGKRNRLSLHSRIELFKKKEPALGDAMMAIKWLGNVGSHAGSDIPRSELLDGLDLLELVLIEVFDKRTKTLARKGRDLIRRKGRPRKIARLTV